MTSNTKLAFSALEAELIQNSQWILTKQSALLKIEELFAAQVPTIQQLIPVFLLSDPVISKAQPRISRGEKYLGLPWIMMDYPSSFGKENIFALRTMFWWGNFFSVTLHLSGEFKQQFAAGIINKLKSSQTAFYLAAGEDEWAHHFESDNYLPAKELLTETALAKIDNSNFIKLAVFHPVQEWSSTETFLKEAYANIFALIR